MAKTTITTPSPRPEALGSTLLLQSTDDVNAAMAELSWCLQRRQSVDTGLHELHEAIIAKRPALVALEIQGRGLTLDERAKELDEAIKGWATAHLKEHLPKDERTLKLEHGEVSVRALPLAIEPTPATVEAAKKAKVSVAEFILDKLNQATSCVSKARAVCAMWFVRATKLLVGDLITVTVALNKSGQVAAYKAGKLDDKTLKSLGLAADDTREAFDFKLKG